MLLIFIFSCIIIAFDYIVKDIRYRKTEYYDQTHLSYLQMRLDKGRYGEYLTYKSLNQIAGYKKYLFNCYIPKEDGNTTEIDVILLHESGIYVFESKNYSGWIFGNANSKMWTQTLESGDKNQFYNPIWQNQSHINYLKQYLGEDIQTISIIVFSDRCELKSISYNQHDFGICNRKKLPRIMKQAWDFYPDTLTQADIDDIYNYLLPLTNVDEETNHQHIQDINTMMNGVGVCPRCGGKLVLRLAKSGTNAGKYFIGCSNYPKCRYTKNLDY